MLLLFRFPMIHQRKAPFSFGCLLFIRYAYIFFLWSRFYFLKVSFTSEGSYLNLLRFLPVDRIDRLRCSSTVGFFLFEEACNSIIGNQESLPSVGRLECFVSSGPRWLAHLGLFFFPERRKILSAKLWGTSSSWGDLAARIVCLKREREFLSSFFIGSPHGSRSGIDGLWVHHHSPSFILADGRYGWQLRFALVYLSVQSAACMHALLVWAPIMALWAVIVAFRILSSG